MIRQPHIVFLTPGFPENERDSTCIPALQIFIRSFSKVFPGRISVISFQYPYQRGHYLWNGMDVYSLAGNNRGWKKMVIWHKARKLVENIHQQYPITHLHSFWLGECALVGQQMATRLKVRHTCTLMGQDALSGNRYFNKLKPAFTLITLSNFQNQMVLNNYHIDSLIIPWGIENVYQKTISKDVDILGVGNLVNEKHFEDFIHIVQRLITLYPRLQARIVGEGPLMNNLRKKIEQLSLEKNIHLLGILPYAETQQLIGRAKILLHMSAYESFGMVFIEALAAQTWVVCRPVGIAAELGLTLKVNTNDEAANVIQEILAENKRPEAVQFSIEDTVDQYMDLIFKDGKDVCI
ncbi:MAG: glycosyltransferase [Saprospiraceae bacterium]|nr:glycosyltransferase [Saprospiraceae bacterium]